MTAFYILVALNVLDAAMTALILQRGGVELNPLMRSLMVKVGTIPALVAVKVAMLTLIYWLNLGEWLWLLVAAYAGICAWNGNVLRRQK